MGDKKNRTACKGRDDKIPLISRLLMFETIMDYSFDSIYFKDKDFRFIYVNKNKAIRHGIKNPAEMNGKTDFDFISESNAKEIFELENSILETGHPIIGKIEKLTLLNGSTTWASSSKYPLYDKNGKIIGIWGISRDITEYELVKEALYLSEAKHKAMIANISDVIIIMDQNGIIKYKSPNIKKCFGWFPEDLVSADIKAIIHPDDQERIQTEFFNVLGKDRSLMTTEYRHKCKDGNYKNVEITAVNLINDTNIEGVLINYHDISEYKKKEEEIEFLSYHDQLTGLYNRRFYETELRRLDTKRNIPMTIAMGDVNGLKLINDSFGHAMGDERLRKAAEVIKNGCRADDIIARLGGDEFVALLPRTSGEDAELIISRINDLSRIEMVGNIDVSISFGCATKSNEEENIQETFKNAEDLMYRNKRSDSSGVRRKTIDLVLNTLYKKSSREQLHSIKVSEICEAIATKMDFSEHDVYQIKLAGLMHDIGKIEIDEKILNKPEKLNKEEWDRMQRHPEIGYRILSSVNEFSGIADDILEHHERWDGKGYPRGLKGDKSSLNARIIAVADAYDAMTSDRTYGKAISEEEAIKEMRRCAGTQFDPEITRIFIEKVLGKEWEQLTLHD